MYVGMQALLWGSLLNTALHTSSADRASCLKRCCAHCDKVHAALYCCSNSHSRQLYTAFTTVADLLEPDHTASRCKHGQCEYCAVLSRIPPAFAHPQTTSRMVSLATALGEMAMHVPVRNHCTQRTH
eukprot:4706-Heterococcus_DN1.PRE.3